MINQPKIDRNKLIGIINKLTENNLFELAMFIDYIRDKSIQTQEIKESDTSFLMSIAGLVTSGETDISDRDEEILKTEISPIQGWTINPNKSL